MIRFDKLQYYGFLKIITYLLITILIPILIWELHLACEKLTPDKSTHRGVWRGMSMNVRQERAVSLLLLQQDLRRIWILCSRIRLIRGLHLNLVAFGSSNSWGWFFSSDEFWLEVLGGQRAKILRLHRGLLSNKYRAEMLGCRSDDNLIWCKKCMRVLTVFHFFSLVLLLFLEEGGLFHCLFS